MNLFCFPVVVELHSWSPFYYEMGLTYAILVKEPLIPKMLLKVSEIKKRNQSKVDRLFEDV